MPAEPACQNCRFSRPPVVETGDQTWLECHRMGSSGGYADHDDTMAVAYDRESYSAFVEVRFNFHCAMFEVKDA